MDILIFSRRDELIKVNPNEIVYFQADGNYSNMILVSGKEQLLTMNLSKVQLTLEEQLGKQSNLYERIGRDLIIRKSYLFSIQTLKKRLILAVPGSEKIFELHVSKDALMKLKEKQEVETHENNADAQLRDLLTRKIYPLKIGLNRFGRQSNTSESEFPIDNGDNQISRQHFIIEVSLEEKTSTYKYFLVDSESANGTFLNNERVVKDTSTLLHFGCKIKAGKTEFILEQTDLDRTEIA
jgi:hypothetical protein